MNPTNRGERPEPGTTSRAPRLDVTLENIDQAAEAARSVRLSPVELVARAGAAALCRTFFGPTFYALHLKREGRDWYVVGARAPKPFGGVGWSWVEAIQHARRKD